MSAFKDQLAKDRDVFLNNDEFGEEHRIDDIAVLCVIDSVGAKPSGNFDSAAMFEDTFMLYAKSEALNFIPRSIGSAVNIDGAEFNIENWNDEAGMSSLTLTRKRMY